MKIGTRMIALLLAAAPALAESGGLVDALATPTPTPAPSPTPAPVEYKRNGLRIALPIGLEPVEDAALEDYEAAVQADYPGAARTILVATDAEDEAALILAEVESGADYMDAAREAAEALIGNPDAPKELECGENRCAYFACAIEEQTFRLYFLSDGERVLIAAASGLKRGEVEAMLAELRFEPEKRGLSLE